MKPVYTTAREALKVVKNGDLVAIGHATGEPQELIRAMVERGKELRGVRVTHMIGMSEGKYCQTDYKDSFEYISLFVGGAARKPIAQGVGDYIPVHFSDIPGLFLDDTLPVDVALIQVSAPDKHGFVSLGISVDYTLAIAQKAKIVIAQINKNMPFTYGEGIIRLSDIDYVVEHDEPLIVLNPPVLTEEDLAIGKNCASLINDGDTIQLGIGSLPDAICQQLKDKKHLGIHSEMFSDGVMDLVECGAVDCSQKNLHKGKMVATFIMGTEKLYKFLDNNPMVYMAPATYVNNPRVICQNDNFVSINSCVQVDFTGQVCSESVGTKQISGTGGQVDFIRGANMSKGGRAIMALSSSAKNGTVSKIVPVLDEGAVVTTPRTDIRYIVTEYGIANMYGKTMHERARALIEIAHPNFRDDLIVTWEQRFKRKYHN